MNFFTKQWYQNYQIELPLFCDIKEAEEKFKKREVESQIVLNRYQEHYKQIKPYLPSCIKEINMHDCIILRSGFIGKDFFMDIDSSGGFGSANKITFINAEILKCNIDSNDAVWLYEEVYIEQSHYELHILFHAKKGELGEMIIRFNELQIQ